MSEKYMDRKKMRREKDEPAELRSKETPVEAAMRIREEEERHAKNRAAEARHDSPESREEIEEATEEYLEKVEEAGERLQEETAEAEHPAEEPIEHKRKFPEASLWPDEFSKKVEYAEKVADLAAAAGKPLVASAILNKKLPAIWDALEGGDMDKAEKKMAKLTSWLTREFNGVDAPEGAAPKKHFETKEEKPAQEGAKEVREEDPAERKAREKIYEEARSLRQSPLRQEFGKYWSGPHGYGPRLSAIEVEGFKQTSPEFLSSELEGIERDIRRDENLAAESTLAFRELRKMLKNHPPESAATPELRRELVRMQREASLISSARDNSSPAELRERIDNLSRELTGLLASAPEKAITEKVPAEKPEWESRSQELLDQIKENPLKKEFPDYWSDKMGEWKMAELRDGKMGERGIPRLQNILAELKKDEEAAEEARQGLVRVVGFMNSRPALDSLSPEQTRALANIDGSLQGLKEKKKYLSPEGVKNRVGMMLRIMEENFPGGVKAAAEKRMEPEEAIESIFAKERIKYPNIRLGNILNLDLVTASPAEKKTLPAKFERVLDAMRNKLGDDFRKYKWNFEVWGPTEKMLAEDAIQVNFMHGNAENIAETVLRSIQRDAEAAKQSAAKEAVPEEGLTPEERFEQAKKERAKARGELWGEISSLVETRGINPEKLMAKTEKILSDAAMHPEAKKQALEALGLTRAGMDAAMRMLDQGQEERALRHSLKENGGSGELIAKRKEYLRAKAFLYNSLAEQANGSAREERKMIDALDRAYAADTGQEEMLEAAGFSEARTKEALEMLRLKKAYEDGRAEWGSKAIPEELTAEEFSSWRKDPNPSPSKAVIGAEVVPVEKQSAAGPAPEAIAPIAEAKESSPEVKLKNFRTRYTEAYGSLRKEVNSIATQSGKTTEVLMREVAAELAAGSPDKREEILKGFAKKNRIFRMQARLLAETAEAKTGYDAAFQDLQKEMYEKKKEELAEFAAKEWPADKRAPGEDAEVEGFIRERLKNFKAKELTNLILSESEALLAAKIDEFPPERKRLFGRMADYAKEKAVGISQWTGRHKWMTKGMMLGVATGAMFIRSGGTAGISELVFFAGSRLGLGVALTAAAEKWGRRQEGIRNEKFEERMSEIRKRFRNNPSLDGISEMEAEIRKALRRREIEKTVDLGLRMVELGILGFVSGQGLRLAQAGVFHHEFALDSHPAKEVPAEKHPAHLRNMEKIRAGTAGGKTELHQPVGKPAAAEAHIPRKTETHASVKAEAEVRPGTAAAPEGSKTAPSGTEHAKGSFMETNTGGNDSAWRMIERQLKNNLGDKYPRDSARQTLLIDYVKDKMGADIKEVMHKGDTLDLGKVLGNDAEVEKAMNLVNKSTEAQLHSIRVHDKLLENWAKTHRGIPLTTERADAIIAESHQAVPPEGLPVGNHNLLPKGIMAPGVEDDSFMYEGAEGVNPLNHNLPAGEAIHSAPSTGEVNPSNHNIPAGQAMESAPAGVNPLNHNVPAGKSIEDYYRNSPVNHNSAAPKVEGYYRNSPLDGIDKIIPSAIKEMRLADKMTGEYSAIKDVSVEEYMKHVPDWRGIYYEPGSADKLALHKLQEVFRLSDGTERTVALSEHHVQLKEYMEGIRPELKGRVRFMSMGKFIELLEKTSQVKKAA